MKLSMLIYPLLSIVLGLSGANYGQTLKKDSFLLKTLSDPILKSNAVNDILVHGNNVWIATGEGLLRTTDDGQSWTVYEREDGFGKGGVSAIDQMGDIVWVATAYDTTTELGELPAGGGLSFSTDNGDTWQWIPQPVDSVDESEYSPTTTHIQNITYDIAISDSAIWIASWGGGLRTSSITEMGEHWRVVTVDGLPFDVSNNNFIHMAFSIIVFEEQLWAGSAAGIHKSTDNGRTWTTYNHQNQPEGISGNFVVAIGHQSYKEKSIVWAATVEAVDESEYRAVSKTEDGGLTWTICLEGEFAHNFAFDDSVVYAATDNGLFKSLDFGETWASFPQIYDSESREGIYTMKTYSVDVGPTGTLWVGSADGLARTTDNGVTWKIFRAYKVPGEGNTPKTYAYPNPFSPLRHNQIGGDGYVRFQYRTTRSTTVTVQVYDFGMNLVRTVVEEKIRSIQGDYAEVWDGRNEIGDMVANGVYFYKISLSDTEPLWGKVMVVN